MMTNTKTTLKSKGPNDDSSKDDTGGKGKFHVVYLGESGFPVGMAAMQKMILISKALIQAGAKVTVINRKSVFDPDKPVDVAPEGTFEGIHYTYIPGTIYRPKGLIYRNLIKARSLLYEFLYLRRLKKNGDLDVGIVSTHNLEQTFLYRLYGLILGFKVVLNYVEWASAREDYRDWRTKINDYIYDKWMIKQLDASLPISEILIENYKKIAPKKPYFKIPVLCDFKKFDLPKRTEEEPYFLYCGSLGYKDVIDFILESYNQLAASPYYLYLVVSGGSKVEREEFQKDISNLKFPEKVKVFSYIPYSQLVDLYLHAKGLLIPLRPNLADAARFPHKIGEYSASGNPIITTNYGEIKHYFEDEENALIADSYDIKQYTEKMQFVIDHPEKARQIGENGKTLGLQEFNYSDYGPKLKAFFERLCVGISA